MPAPAPPPAVAAGGEPALLTGWGRTAPSLAHLHHPAAGEEVASLIAAAGPRGLIARGLGRSYGDAAQNAGGRVLATDELRGVRGFDPATGLITVGAGLDLGALARLTLPHGWFPPVVPGTAHVTIGGAIAADIHGKNHHSDGSFCSHVRSFVLQAPAGGRLLVTPEDDPGTFHATAGGMGLTGVILEATVQLLAVESDRARVDTERARDLDDVLDRMERGDDGYRYSVAWIDCLARGRSLGRSVLIRGEHASAAEAASAGRSKAPAYAPGRMVAAPPAVPNGLLNPASLRAFNEAYFRRAPREERGRIEPIHAFFHPLDALRDWNRLYGSRGLLQHQFVVPFGAEDVLRGVVERLAGERVPTFLTVLKRFGAQRTGRISFPTPGWTLAVDMPAGRASLAPLLDGFDELIAAAGGRIYLAKDSRLRGELLGDMYPELESWRTARRRLDPAGIMHSDLARRLPLR